MVRFVFHHKKIVMVQNVNSITKGRKAEGIVYIDIFYTSNKKETVYYGEDIEQRDRDFHRFEEGKFLTTVKV